MKVLKYYYATGFFGFRVFGVGLKIKDLREYPLLFSERNGYSKGFTIGNYRIGILKSHIS